jgi:hypothetical protein
MLRPLAIAIGLALCLLGPSSAYAGKISRLGCAWEGWFCKNWEGSRYKNGKVILAKPIKWGRRFEQGKFSAWGVLGPPAAYAAGYAQSLWNNRQK